MSDAQHERMRAAKLTLPVMCGYLFLGTAFGATLAQAGFGPAWALMMSTLVYAGTITNCMLPAYTRALIIIAHAGPKPACASVAPNAVPKNR